MGDLKREPSSDICFSWGQFWSYFTSSFCTDEMRAFSLKHLNLIDSLDGKLPSVQFEILEYAPKEIIQHPSIQKVLAHEVKIKFGYNNSQPTNIVDDARKAELRKRFQECAKRLS